MIDRPANQLAFQPATRLCYVLEAGKASKVKKRGRELRVADDVQISSAKIFHFPVPLTNY
jgi:hypothetical protein